MKLVKKFLHLSFKEKVLFFEAVGFLYYSKVLITFLPFRKALKYNTEAKKYSRTDVDSRNLIYIRDAMFRANKFGFWKNKCLVSSFAARFLLNRRGYVSEMFFGLEFRNGKQLVAHAWLISEAIFITPKGKTKYKEILKV